MGKMTVLATDIMRSLRQIGDVGSEATYEKRLIFAISSEFAAQ
jgi:hypothetical protein